MYCKLTLVGNVGKEPEVRYTPAGVMVASFSVAHNPRPAKEGDEPKPQWYKVTCWRSLAETVAQYVQKGQLVLVDGELEMQEWTDRDGNVRTTPVVNASTVRFLSGKPQAQAED